MNNEQSEKEIIKNNSIYNNLTRIKDLGINQGGERHTVITKNSLLKQDKEIGRSLFIYWKT